MSTMLLVIDMQNGFVTEKCKHIIPNVITLIKKFSAAQKPIVFTRFINSPHSSYVKFINWSKCKEEPEISIIPELQSYVQIVFNKPYYTAFTDDFLDFISVHSIHKIYLCGVATDSCVLKTAMDSFECGIEPVVVKDACYSHGGQEAHDAGLFVISRNIGSKQMRYLHEIED